MTIRPALALFTLLACACFAEPPAQADLPRQDLARMKSSEREELDLLLGVGFGGISDVTPLSGDNTNTANFSARVVVLQPWSFNDPASQKSLQQVYDSLQGLDDVLIIAMHPQQQREKVDRMLERRPMPGVVVLDADDHYIGPLGLNVRGANLIVDRSAVIRYTGINPAAVRTLVVELLSEKPDPSHNPEVNVSGFAEQRAQAKDLRTKIEQAWGVQDYAAGMQLMDELWQIDRATASQMSRTLLGSGSSLQSVIGLEQIARNAPTPGLLDAVAGLNPRLQRNEISILVRALGSREIEEPVATLRPFLDSRDVYVRQAALYALGDLGSPGDIALFVDELRNAPIVRDDFGQDDDDRIMNTLFGVAYKLTGYRGVDARDYAQWLAVYQADPKQAEEVARLSIADAQNRPLSVQFSSDTFLTFDGYDLAFRLQDANPSQMDPSIPRAFTSAIARTRAAAAPVLGVVYPAPFRVYVADDTGFASLAGNTYMGGQSEVNKVFLRHESLNRMDPTFAHEYVHVLHQAMYENQPRWLAEGLAESISTSTQRWSSHRLVTLGIDQAANDGVFSRLLSWGSISSDARESENYRLSHLAVDFLRFGPYPAGETRLHLLMASISQGRGERQALADFYADPGTLDDQVRAWLQSP